MKKCMTSILAAAVILSNSACSLASEDPLTNDGITTEAGAVKILYNGENVDFDVAPVNEDGTVLVPMRAVFEKFGAKVKWDSETKTVSARKGNKTYQMTLGEKRITEIKNEVETNAYEALQSMKMVDDRTMIPLRAVGEILGLEVNWDSETQTVTIDSKSKSEDASWKENLGSADLSELTAAGEGITVSGNVIKITKGGDFTITGANNDAQIVVDTVEEEKVRLRLNGVSLTNTKGAAVYVSSADKLYITLEDGTSNVLSDGGEYSENAETNACIHSKTDLEINGDGSLTVNGNVHNGISAKDDFEISGGTVNITAVNDGIHVNDTAEFNGGSVSITAGADGIQSESILDITDGSISIECTGEVTVTDTPMFGMGGRAGRTMAEPAPTGEPAEEDTEDTSSKGIKAGWMLDISGGETTINSNDTCVKCDSELNISGGTLTLTSEKKKGIKGMEDVNISGGRIEILKSTEGIEAKRIMTVSGGDIDVIASDDGLNAGGGGMGFGGGMQPSERMDSGMRPGAMEGEQGMQAPERPDSGMRPGAMEGEQDQQMPERPENETGMMHRGGMGGRAEAAEISSEHHIEISGGDIYINAQGDGIDSNGSLIISGGNVIVDGPEGGGNSALDHDGLFEINGGTVIAVSSAGMIENPSDASAQNVISAYITAANGSEITIKSSSGKEVCSYKVNKNVGHIMFSSAELAAGEAYTIYVDGTEAVSGEIQSALTMMGSSAGGFGGKGGQGGMRMPRNSEERPTETAN